MVSKSKQQQPSTRNSNCTTKTHYIHKHFSSFLGKNMLTDI